jgi:hypothetical protein
MYEKDGEKKYLSYFRFPDKLLYEAFSQKVKEAIEKHASSQGQATSSMLDEEIPF